MMVDFEPEATAYLSGLKNWIKTHTIGLCLVGGAFLIGAALGMLL